LVCCGVVWGGVEWGERKGVKEARQDKKKAGCVQTLLVLSILVV
jgi:hypothetical protein